MKNPWKKLISNVKISGRVGLAYAALHGNEERNSLHKISITWQDLQKKFAEQKNKCFWLGVPIDPNWIFKSWFPMAPSVDRIDNLQEYTYENIVICTRFANLARGSCEASKFAKIIVALKNKGINPDMDEFNKLF
jgi:hypothetical protein